MKNDLAHNRDSTKRLDCGLILLNICIKTFYVQFFFYLQYTIYFLKSISNNSAYSCKVFRLLIFTETFYILPIYGVVSKSSFVFN